MPALPTVAAPPASCKGTQRLQYPLIKEYTLSYSRIPSMVQGMVLIKGYWSLLEPSIAGPRVLK